MNPPVFDLLTADPDVTALVGSSNPAIYDSGYAPEGVSTYVVWQIVTGVPEAYLSERPDIETARVQLDCYAPDRVQAIALGNAVRDALELDAHQVSQNIDEREPQTRLHRWGMDFEFWLDR